MAKTRWTVDVSKELDRAVNDIAAEDGVTKSDVLRRAVALLKLAHEAQKRGDKVILRNDAEDREREVLISG